MSNCGRNGLVKIPERFCCMEVTKIDFQNENDTILDARKELFAFSTKVNIENGMMLQNIKGVLDK